MGYSQARQNFGGGVVSAVRDAQQDVLGGDVVVLEARRFIKSARKRVVSGLAQKTLAYPGNLRQPCHRAIDFRDHSFRRYAELREQRRDYTIVLREQRPE